MFKNIKGKYFSKFPKTDLLLILFLSFLLLFTLFLKKRYIFNYQFDNELIKEYLVSQDIEDPNRIIKNRTFLSDEEIYFSSGYLYARGESPGKYNFQHPPLIKYLFGISIRSFNNPYIVQIIFSWGVVVLVYLLALRIFSDRRMAIPTSLLLLLDPIFIDVSSLGLLDLGQTFFLLIFIYLALFKSKNLVMQGLVLGLALSSKFWPTTLMAFIFIVLFERFYLKKKLVVLNLLKILFLSGVVYLLMYWKFFVLGNGFLNFIALQLRILKFMVTHNSSTLLGSNLILFISGFYRDWWKGYWVREPLWTPLWSLGFLSSLVLVINTFRNKKRNIRFFVFCLPLFYFFITLNQLPFARYFLPILPFVYMSLGFGLLKLFRRM